MPYVPVFPNLGELSSETVNAVAADIGANVTVVVGDNDSLKPLANFVLGSVNNTNAFLDGLVNRIAISRIINRAFENPLKRFKQGVLDYGELYQEIFVNIQKGERRVVSYSEPADPFAAKIPDVHVDYQICNLESRYETSVDPKQLRRAFLSWSGLNELVNKITRELYDAYNTDEYLMTKFIILSRAAYLIKNGEDYKLLLNNPTEKDEAIAVLKTARDVSGQFTFNKPGYTIDKDIWNHCPIENQVTVLNTRTNANIDVEALAQLFNLSKAEFINQNRVLLDSFTLTAAEIERICAVTGFTSETFPLTADDLNLTEGIDTIIMDEGFVRIFDIVEPYMTEGHNFHDDVYLFNLFINQSYGTSPYRKVCVIDNLDLIAITNTLSHCKTNNSATKIGIGQHYIAAITADEGYTLEGATVSITMGGVDITSEAYDDGDIDIPFVDGALVISVTAKSAG